MASGKPVSLLLRIYYRCGTDYVHGSFTIAGKRVADLEVYAENCCILYRNPIKHALLYCREMETERNILWDWFLDKLPIVVSSTLYLMDDDQFLYTLFGDLPRMDSSEDYAC